MKNNDTKLSLFLLSSIGGLAILSYWVFRSKKRIHNDYKRKDVDENSASPKNLDVNHNLEFENMKKVSFTPDVMSNVTPGYKETPQLPTIKPPKSPNLHIEIPSKMYKNKHKTSSSVEKSVSKDYTTVEDTNEYLEKVHQNQKESENYYYRRNSFSSSEFSDSWELSSLNEDEEDLRTQFISPLLKEESTKGKKFIWDFLKTQTDPVFGELQLQFEKTLERNFSLAESTYLPSERSELEETEIRETERKVRALGKNHMIRKFFTNRLSKTRTPPTIAKPESMKSYLKGKCPDIKLQRRKQGKFIR